MNKKKEEPKWEYQGRTQEQYTASSAIVFYAMIGLFITMLTLTLYTHFAL